ncbi:hypothetical protein [uncultured Mediterranean phage]|nr:hypothetical protein [uncultured Mediterranean phage]
MLGTLVSTILPIAETVIDRVVPDKNAKARALQDLEHMLVEAETKGQLAQIEVNKIEAASRSVWTSGWRPFIGWSCGFAMAYAYVVQPILVFVLAQSGYLIDLPRVELGEMMPILLGMLGLGGLRSFEKYKKVSK